MEASFTCSSGDSGVGTRDCLLHRQEAQGLLLGGVHLHLEGIGLGIALLPQVDAGVLAPLVRLRVAAPFVGLGAVAQGRLCLQQGIFWEPPFVARGLAERRRSDDTHLLVEDGEVARAPRAHRDRASLVASSPDDLCLDALRRLGGVDALAQGDEAVEKHVERRLCSAEAHPVGDALDGGVRSGNALRRFSLAGVVVYAPDNAFAADTERGGQILLLRRDWVARQLQSQDAKVTVEWEQRA